MTAIGGYYSSGAYPLGGLLLPGGNKMSKGGAKLVGYEVLKREDTTKERENGRGRGNQKRMHGMTAGQGRGRPEACIHPYPSRGGYWDFDYLF